jgi:hypothetical protein
VNRVLTNKGFVAGTRLAQLLLELNKEQLKALTTSEINEVKGGGGKAQGVTTSVQTVTVIKV